MIIYTNLMPKRFQGYNLGPVTLIRPACKNDPALHAHEEVHRQQFYRNPFMGLFYLFSLKARQRYEVEAYRAQLRHNPQALFLYAHYLTTNYGLKLSMVQAVTLLTEAK